jgi:DNA-binding SARP family transcriptional activator/tetratricopeptide (TPR) repeat protein
LRYRILGEFTMWRGDAQIPLPGGVRLAILAVLLLNANRQISSGDLVRAGWGDSDGAETQPTQLHKSISWVRGVLDALGRRSDLITHPRIGYELRVEEGELDKAVFERLVRDADQAGSAGRSGDEVELLRRALEIWRGPQALPGLSGSALRQDARDLEQRRKRAAVRLFDLELARGQHERIVPEVATIAGYHPADRRLCEQLMIALYHSGHTAEAVEAFERHAGALEAATGAQPEAAVRRLTYAIAAADESVIAQYTPVAVRTAAPAPRSALVVPPRQLPPAPADFVGREDAVDEARWLLTREPDGTVPVVVACGPGGIGKSALAVHIAHQVRSRYPDGQLYVDLRGTSAQPVQTAEVLAQLLRAFELPRVPEERAERVGLYRSLAADRRLLVVLDDARDEAQVRDLIPGHPGCGVLITARKWLSDLDGAHHLPALQPLDQARATELYARVAGRSGVDTGAEPEATRRIVELCAGLPLALCVAGAQRGRDQGRTGDDLAERLARQRLQAFVYNERSVERSIGASYERLDEAAQALFLGLGLLALPDFGEWTAAAVLDGTGADPAETLLTLASWQLLQPAGPGMRYRFHDLTREYARRRAEDRYSAEPRRLAVRQRVYTALLTLARRAHRGIYGGDFEVVHGEVADWLVPEGVRADLDRNPLAWYEPERSNIRAAVNHTAELGLTTWCWDLAISAHEFYTISGYFDDWHATHRTALAACRSAGDGRGEAAMLAMLGQPALVASRRSGVSGAEDLRRAAELFGAAGDRRGQAIALRTLANNMLRRGQREPALATLDQALPHYIASGDVVGHCQTLRYIGQTYLDLERHDEALRALEAADSVAAGLSQPRLLAQTRYWIGRAKLAGADTTGARSEFLSVLAILGDARDSGRAYATFGLGSAAQQGGDPDSAERYLHDAADLAREMGDSTLEGRSFLALATVHQGPEAADRRVSSLVRAVECLGRTDAGHLHATALGALGDAYADRGRVAEARAAWTEAVGLFGAMRSSDAEPIRRRLSESAS